MIDLKEFFDKHSEEFLKFDRVQNKRSMRNDMHAFLLLDELDPSNRDMVSAASHDEIWLSANPEMIKQKATEDQLIELIRCGVRYSSEYDGFCMFV